ncbi:hypothetical protein BGZ49_003414 [Haplosporangium sp. Z 27]|nr:hypothetical protein BGZ49_003414 [Haplosporangium sp. Z 27]
MQRNQVTPYQRYRPVPPSASVGSSANANEQEHQVPVRRHNLQHPSPYRSCTPYGAKFPPVQAYSRQRPAVPTFSAQARKTFVPQQIGYTPDAAMVPIRALQPLKSFVRVSGRTVRASDVKEYIDKKDGNKQRWIQSFTMKDDYDTIEVKIWHKSKEHRDSYAHISLDQVVHVWTDDVKLNTKPSFGNQALGAPTTSSPLLLSLTEGKIGHKIDLGNETEMVTLFKTGLDANIAGIVPSVSLKQVLSALNSIGNERFNLIVCVKKMVSSALINTRNGPSTKTLFTVFDAQGQEASLTLWGDCMASVGQQWDPLKTTLILTGAQVSMYALKPQITIGYQTHIQVNPECKNVEWLKHFAARCSSQSDELNPGDSKHINTFAESAYGFTYAILSEFDIENRSSEILTAKCPSCKHAITSYKIEDCQNCHVSPKNESSWSFTLAHNISFMDDTAELYHPSMTSNTVQNFIGFQPKNFGEISMVDRARVKERYFLERFKLYFKVSWSDFKKRHVVYIISIEMAHLQDLEPMNVPHL